MIYPDGSCDDYFNMTEKDAERLAVAKGYSTRVTRRDGYYPVVTRDWRRDRMNFTIDDGTITSAYQG